MYHLSGAIVDGEFIPADHDSFYHARRIIDTIPSLANFYQFDPRIHAPEGSWLTWPWGYDFTVALITKVAMRLTGATNPMSVIAFIAPVFVFVNAALLLAILSQLRISLLLQVAVMLSFACSVLTRALHRVGMVDHHFVEHMFVLATLYCGLRWIESPADRRRAILLGAVLGLAPAFHIGDFVLQIPIVAMLGYLWWHRRAITRRDATPFATTLAAVTTLALLPSEPFRQGMFAYTLHSWFHFYVAACTAATSILCGSIPRTTRTSLLFGMTATILAGPILGQAKLGGDFLFGNLVDLDKIREVENIFDYIRQGEIEYMTQLYSGLIWLLPFGLAWSIYRIWRGDTDQHVLLAIYSLFGATLLLMQFRLQYFGAFALWILPCVALEHLTRTATARKRKIAMVSLVVLMIVATLPSLKSLRTPTATGGEVDYMLLRNAILALREPCRMDPGTVLAVHNLGHYLTYHTGCSVISDNFILTRQHEEKLVLTDELLRSKLDVVLRETPYVRYIVVARQDNVFASTCYPTCTENQGLVHQLLETEDPLPKNLQLLIELKIKARGTEERLARVFKILQK